MATWPTNVNSSPLLEGYSKTTMPSKLVSTVDAGKLKVRQRFTAVPKMITERFIWTTPEKEAFETWYATDAKYGAEEFFRENPETGLTEAYEFAPGFEPVYNVVGYARQGPLYSVQLELETVVV